MLALLKVHHSLQITRNLNQTTPTETNDELVDLEVSPLLFFLRIVTQHVVPR